MKTFIFTISSLLLLASFVIAQNETIPAEADPAAGDIVDPKPKPALLPFPAQCLYDIARKRVNHDCLIANMPPTCEKGKLVQTMIGDEYEMCCCNYSNFVDVDDGPK